MQARMSNPAMVLPGAMQAIQDMFKATGKGGVPPATLELVHLHASQINGCSACVDSGARSAKRPVRPTSGSSPWPPGGRRPTSPPPNAPRWRWPRPPPGYPTGPTGT
jgi:hypothetical protein